MKNNKVIHITQICAAILIFAAGFFVGRQTIPSIERAAGITNKEAHVKESVDFEPFWKVWNLINEKYVAVDDVTAQEKVWGAIEGLTESLDDPYSVFLPPEETKLFSEMVLGSFGGVGMEIGEKEDLIVVITPLKGTPAEKAGIKSGDVILQIDTTPTTGLSVDEAVQMIRGEAGSTVVLHIGREGEENIKIVSLVREDIQIPTLETAIRDDVFIISLYNFDAFSAEEFKSAMKEFLITGKKKLIIDLRNNPGGFLEAAVDIASHFLPSGEIIVREKFDEGDTEKVHRSKGHQAIDSSVSVLVLVNKGSASASEIVAGALQEHGIAKLIGETTFGKGSVQELISVTPETSLKLTVAQWLTPQGKSISKGGLTPDIIVQADSENAQKDLQLEKAIEILSKE